MAIQPRNIPSPQEIKSTPQSFNPEEINQIKDLRNKINQVIFKFGQHSINKLKLEEAGKELQQELSSLENQEKNLAQSLTNKYGKGSIDLETGTFTPTE
jgi:hypothetical protein